MGRLYRAHLEGPEIFNCRSCKTHLSTNDQIISKDFHGRGGRAYLFNTAINVYTGHTEKRHLITGWHTVCDLYCICCQG